MKNKTILELEKEQLTRWVEKQLLAIKVEYGPDGSINFGGIPIEINANTNLTEMAEFVADKIDQVVTSEQN